MSGSPLGFTPQEGKNFDSIQTHIVSADQVIVDDSIVVTSGVIELSNGTAAAPSLTFTSDPDTGVFSSGANSFGVSVGGTNTLNVTPTQTRVIQGDLQVVTGDLEVVAPASTLKMLNSGAVTQGTSNATGVILNTHSGEITMFATIAADTGVTFTVTNSVVTATSLIFANCLVDGETANNIGLNVAITRRLAGSFDITVNNADAAAATMNPAIIAFLVVNTV